MIFAHAFMSLQEFHSKVKIRKSCCLYTIHFITFSLPRDWIYCTSFWVFLVVIWVCFLILSHKVRLLYTTRQFHSTQIRFFFFIFQFIHFWHVLKYFLSLIQLSLSFTLQGEEDKCNMILVRYISSLY